MMRHGLSMMWVIAGLAFPLMTGTASAQCTTCGTTHAKSDDCGHGGLKQYPRFDSKYIKKFCAPTICPGSCNGYFQTKWTPWAYACPQWTPGGMPPDPAMVNWYPPTYGPQAGPTPAAIPHANTVPPQGSEPVPAPRPTVDKEPALVPMPTIPPAPPASPIIPPAPTGR